MAGTKYLKVNVLMNISKCSHGLRLIACGPQLESPCIWPIRF